MVRRSTTLAGDGETARVYADVRQRLKAAGVETLVHYPTPIHLHQAYAHLDRKPGSFPVSETLAGEILSLPIYPELRDDELQYTARCVRELLA